MAKYVKISLLSQPALYHSPYSDDLESKVQEMMAYLKENIQQVLWAWILAPWIPVLASSAQFPVV